VEIRTTRPVADMHTLTTWALDRGVELPSLRLVRPTLEEAYLQLTEAAPGTEPGDGAHG
jgi:ABC-2 type transport system ATP-binding protein